MSGDHDAFDFVFGAMTSAERARAKMKRTHDRGFAAQIDCVAAGMAPLALAEEASGVPATLWSDIEAILDQDAAEDPNIRTEYFEDGVWLPLTSGIDVRPCWGEAAFLLRCAPSATLPAHTHDVDERMIVISGSIVMGSRSLTTGDYQFSRQGSEHAAGYSANGCLLLIQRG
jgi:hypothetical protein